MRKLIIFCLLALGGMTSNVEAVEMPDNSLGFASYGPGTLGGQNGIQLFVETAHDFRDAVRGDLPATIYVNSKIDLTDLFVSSPGVIVDVGSNKSIIGISSESEITGGGLRIRGQEQVIIRNLKLTNALSFDEGEYPDGNGGIQTNLQSRLNPGDFTEIDAITIENSQHVWVDHNYFSDEPWIAADVPTGSNRHDGLIDIKRGSNWVTISNNIFTNHNKTILVGHSDSNAAQDLDKLKVTFAYNWFKGTEQRNPRVRFGEVHVLNNLYTDISSYGIGVGVSAQVIAEENTFINTRRSWGHPDGPPSPMGYLLNKNNLLINSSYDQDQTGKYQEVPSYGINWNPSVYYKLPSIPVNEVEVYVKANAGQYTE
ncbi:pectate lyase [Enterococcus mundtii]|uniref:Pectate lyase n=2 Tax=Enterococcus mundtii TaxID=53346 RepID=A0A1V2UCB3_ENTMU|nr:pectate lyase [Enterococcus mundtii]